MIRSVTSKRLLLPFSRLGCAPILYLRFSSTQIASTQQKQFKRSTLPSSSSSPISISNEILKQETTQETNSNEKQFADHMDDLKSTKCVNQLISDHNDLPLSLSITKRAASKLQDLIKTDGNPNVALKIKVESGGCHGFQYDLKLSDDFNKDFNPNDEETMFIRDGVARIIIDKTSLEILRDSKVDYVNELIGSQFKVVDSPYTTSSCGCGSSFDFDFDKLNEASSK